MHVQEWIPAFAGMTNAGTDLQVHYSMMTRFLKVKNLGSLGSQGGDTKPALPLKIPLNRSYLRPSAAKFSFCSGVTDKHG